MSRPAFCHHALCLLNQDRQPESHSSVISFADSSLCCRCCGYSKVRGHPRGLGKSCRLIQLEMTCSLWSAVQLCVAAIGAAMTEPHRCQIDMSLSQTLHILNKGTSWWYSPNDQSVGSDAAAQSEHGKRWFDQCAGLTQTSPFRRGVAGAKWGARLKCRVDRNSPRVCLPKATVAQYQLRRPRRSKGTLVAIMRRYRHLLSGVVVVSVRPRKANSFSTARELRWADLTN
jgi:hypothetical protein